MSAFSATTLRLSASDKGVLKVQIIDFSDVAGKALEGINRITIKSVSLFVTRSDEPYTSVSNTYNGDECIFTDDKGLTTLLPEFTLADALTTPAKYDVELTFTYVNSASSIVDKVFKETALKVLGDVPKAEIKEIRQGTVSETNAAGTILALKISPNGSDGLNTLVTDDIKSVVILQNGAKLAAKNYTADGIYEVTGLTADVEYSFSAYIVSHRGFTGDVSATLKGTPLKTPQAAVPTGVSGLSGNYFITTSAIPRAKLGAGATDAEQTKDQLTNLKIYAYVHAANDLLLAPVLDASYNLVGTVNAIVNADGSSDIPAGQLNVEGAFNGRWVRYFVRASNGYGAGKSIAGAPFRVMSNVVSAPAVSCTLLSGNKYEIAVTPGAAVTGYTLLGYKVELKKSTTATWGTLNDCSGNFAPLVGADDILLNVEQTGTASSGTNAIAYLDAIDKVTSSNKKSTADVVTLKASSKAHFLLERAIAVNGFSFDVRATGIYEQTHELKQVELGAVVLGSDLRTAGGFVALSTQKLVYGAANTVFADAGGVAYNATGPVAAVSNNILLGDKLSDFAYAEKVSVITLISAAGSTPTAEFVSASGVNATYKMSMTKFDISAVTENGITCSYDTHSVKYSIVKKGVYPEYSEIASLTGSILDSVTFSNPKVSKQFDVLRGERSEVGVQVSVYNSLNRMIAQSAVTMLAEPLIPSGKDAYTGLTVMSHGDQGAVAYPAANTEGADFKWVLNRAATGFAADKCRVRIAFETSSREVSGSQTHYPTKDANMAHPAFMDADWVKETLIYELNEKGEEIKTLNVGAGTPDHKEFAETGKPIRAFNVYTLAKDLIAMRSYSFKVHRDWKKVIVAANPSATPPVAEVAEYLRDSAPITVTITPTIAVQKRTVAFFPASGKLESIFTIAAAETVNGADQLKAISAGGVFNSILVKDAAGKYAQPTDALSSAARFMIDIVNGEYILATRSQYLSPNFGKTYNVDTKYVMSEQTSDVRVVVGAGPAQLVATVESVKLTQAIKDVTTTDAAVNDHGCLFAWPELATGSKVTISAVFDDSTADNLDKSVSLATNLEGKQYFVKHADIYDKAGFAVGKGKYFKYGVKFLAVVKDAAGASSLPKVLAHMPKGATDFKIADFDVISGANKLTIKYNGSDETETKSLAKSASFAGQLLIPATITYTDSVSGQKDVLTTLDITGADGVAISGLNDNRSYVISVAIAGQSSALAIGTHSSAALPKAVTLEVKPVSGHASYLSVIFKAATDNGSYGAATSYNMYMTTQVMIAGVLVTKYVNPNAFEVDARTVIANPSVGTTTLAGLKEGRLYTVEIESVYAAITGSDSAQKVSASASGTPCDKPVIVDFRLDSNNKVARMMVDINGAKLNTLLLFPQYAAGYTGAAMLKMDLTSAANAQSDYAVVPLNLTLPAGVSNVMAIAVNSQGVHLAAANSSQWGQGTSTNGGYSAVTNGPWIVLEESK
jgi:hypothetical protein